MRRFLILGHTQLTRPPLPLNDPAGAGGRWDLLARCLTTGLLVSHGVRKDTEILLALLAEDPCRVVRVSGAQVRNLNPDERSTIALTSKALEGVDVGEHWTPTLPGFSTRRTTLDRLLSELAATGPLVALRESALTRIDEWAPTPGEDATFVLGDHREPSPEEWAIIDKWAGAAVRVGPLSLHADQCLTLVHSSLDCRGEKGSP